jgi:hypothetical protein
MVQSPQFVDQVFDSVSPKVGFPHFCCCMDLFAIVPGVGVALDAARKQYLVVRGVDYKT